MDFEWIRRDSPGGGMHISICKVAALLMVALTRLHALALCHS